MNIILAQPMGFCAGVDRAVKIVEKAIELYGPPVYVRHEIVHNKHVVDNLKEKGVVFVENLSEISKDNAIVVFSAHGVSKDVEKQASLRNFKVIDATCPLVKKVHNEVLRHDSDDIEVILIGHANHPEVEGTSGRIENKVLLVSKIEDVASLQVKDVNKIAYVTQTTLSIRDTSNIIKALKQKFPNITGPDLNDICYATQNRQNAVVELSKRVDLLIVVGANNSSNSNRLRDLGEEMDTKSYLISKIEEIEDVWFEGVNNVGITAGASAPDILITKVVDFLSLKFKANVLKMDGIKENIEFKLPKELYSF